METGLYCRSCLTSSVGGHVTVGVGFLIITEPTFNPWPRLIPNDEPGTTISCPGKRRRSRDFSPTGIMSSWMYPFNHCWDRSFLQGLSTVMPMMSWQFGRASVRTMVSGLCSAADKKSDMSWCRRSCNPWPSLEMTKNFGACFLYVVISILLSAAPDENNNRCYTSVFVCAY